jgi:hypothetical protein
MPERAATEAAESKPDGAEAAKKLQTVGQLKAWLKPFSDHERLLGASQGRLLAQSVTCRHAEGHVIVEVPGN